MCFSRLLFHSPLNAFLPFQAKLLPVFMFDWFEWTTLFVGDLSIGFKVCTNCILFLSMGYAYYQSPTQFSQSKYKNSQPLVIEHTPHLFKLNQCVLQYIKIFSSLRTLASIYLHSVIALQGIRLVYESFTSVGIPFSSTSAQITSFISTSVGSSL